MYENLIDAMTSIHDNRDVLGWGLPGQIYFITESLDDPTLMLVGETPPGVDMGENLLTGFDAGFRLPPFALGMVVVTEGARHLFFEELKAIKPEIIESWDTYGQDPEDYYFDHVVPNLGNPMDLPLGEMRVELRFVLGVLPDGTHFTVARPRGGDEDEKFIGDKEHLREQRLPAYIYMFMHGVRPQEADPIQLVEDKRIVEEMAQAWK